MQELSDFICGYPLFILLIGGGLFLFLYSGALPLRKLGAAFRSLKMKKAGSGQITSFQALMSTISSTVGVGNIAGVAIALAVGGPGAIFWMWMSALLGMATKFFEGVLAIKYKGVDENGQLQGGPMYVLTKGIGPRMKPLAILFACSGMIGCLALMQANQLAETLSTICVCPLLGVEDSTLVRLAIGIIMAAVVLIVILGGLGRIARVATRMVPTMVACYFLMVLYIIVTHFNLLPHVFSSIFHGAFSLEAGIGGLMGVALTGARRAMFVNEAGVGTAGMMHGASMNTQPVREGLVAMLGPAIDSGFVCTLSAIPIIMADNFHVSGVEGLSIAFGAYNQLIPHVGRYCLLFMIVVFAMSTMFSYSYYGSKCTAYLFGSKNVKYYTYFYVLTLVVSSVITLSTVVSLMDMAFFFMALPNMIALFALAPKVRQEVKRFRL